MSPTTSWRVGASASAISMNRFASSPRPLAAYTSATWRYWRALSSFGLRASAAACGRGWPIRPARSIVGPAAMPGAEMASSGVISPVAPAGAAPGVPIRILAMFACSVWPRRASSNFWRVSICARADSWPFCIPACPAAKAEPSAWPSPVRVVEGPEAWSKAAAAERAPWRWIAARCSSVSRSSSALGPPNALPSSPPRSKDVAIFYPYRRPRRRPAPAPRPVPTPGTTLPSCAPARAPPRAPAAWFL